MNDMELLWDIGTGYDFFISLEVIHDPIRFGLRGSWAAGVRSRLPGPERDLLQNLIKTTWPLHWVHSLPAPKNGQTILSAMRKIPADQWLPTLIFGGYCPLEWQEHLLEVADRGSFSDKDVSKLIAYHEKNGKGKKSKDIKKSAREMLEVWAAASEYEDGLLDAFSTYYDSFFAEEELRIRPALEAGLASAQELAQQLPVENLLLELSQGVLITEWKDLERLILVPSFWSTPLMLFVPLDDKTELRIFGARPADASLVPGEVVPDALFQALKSLADPTRLRILRYLMHDSLSPAELARRLRLRPPTVLHHLDSLRLARLVQLTLSHEGKRYSARPEAIKETCNMLNTYVSKESLGELLIEE